ncbi:MAG TPA: tetratricopeptide repeat protein, partial [Pyrinomonadaceae bacterium]
DSDTIARGLSELATTERLAGDLDAAERDYREALQISKAAVNHQSVAVCLCQLGLLALKREEWADAETLICEALPLSKKLGRHDLIAWNCSVLAKALAQQGRKPEAIQHAQCAVEIFTALRSPSLEWARQILAECES